MSALWKQAEWFLVTVNAHSEDINWLLLYTCLVPTKYCLKIYHIEKFVLPHEHSYLSYSYRYIDLNRQWLKIVLQQKVFYCDNVIQNYSNFFNSFLFMTKVSQHGYLTRTLLEMKGFPWGQASELYQKTQIFLSSI